MRAAIYTRISLDQRKGTEQEGLGVQRQLDECLKLADHLGWEVVAQFQDNDTSAYAKRKKRPGYEALLDAMKNGEVQAVLCWHTDRLYRRVGDLERLIDIADNQHVEIRTVQGGDLDLSNSTGKMVARILASVANAESEHKGERHKASNVQKAARGDWQTGARPFGYTLKTGEPLEPEATAFRQAVADVLAGKSIQGIARQWNEEGLTTSGGKQWTGPNVRGILVKPRYAGLKVLRGQVVGPGTWTPLIDEDTHRHLVAVLTAPGRATSTSFERKFLGAGLYLCGRCNDGTTMKTGGRGSGRGYQRGYICRAQAHLGRIGQPLDDYVTATVLERLTQPDAATLIAGVGADLSGLAAQREALQAKLDLDAALYADDKMTTAQFVAVNEVTRAKLAEVDEKLATGVGKTSPAAALVAAGPEKVWSVWQSMTVTQRAAVVDEVAVVTVLPSPRGLRGFDHRYVTVQFRCC